MRTKELEHCLLRAAACAAELVGSLAALAAELQAGNKLLQRELPKDLFRGRLLWLWQDHGAAFWEIHAAGKVFVFELEPEQPELQGYLLEVARHMAPQPELWQQLLADMDAAEEDLQQQCHALAVEQEKVLAVWRRIVET